MNRIKISNWAGIMFLALIYTGCSVPAILPKKENRNIPVSYYNSQDSTNTGKVNWKNYFTDPYLTALIDSAFSNNQELNITMQEIEISRQEIRARKGEYLPVVGLGGAAGVEKLGRYTNMGASEATTDIKAAVSRYLASIEGKNFMMTNLISEIANSYYELLALDNQLTIIQQNIDIQNNALKIVKMQKEATRVTELAVRRFEAQVLHTQNLQYDIKQRITVTENRINFLVGRYPQHVKRNSGNILDLAPNVMQTGVPMQLLENRPDVQQAENELAATKLDIEVARANFYPSLSLSAGLGLRAFNPVYIAKLPESLIASLAGELVGPLINKNAIKAAYASANAKQIQAVYNYEKTVLSAYIEVANELSNISNLGNSYDLKFKEVEALTESTNISNALFRSARADYMEVLLTQREALESKFDLVETRMKQLNSTVNMYRALGGGWK
jgi:multidrug efflux system outer membrane protein